MHKDSNGAKTVLISGASIAGPTLAFWLQRHGFQVTVVERAESLRLGGQNIDVKGPAREVARLMGIEQAIKDAHTGEQGVLFVDQANTVKAAIPQQDGGLTSELEILRGDLVQILVDLTKADVEYIYGDHIVDLLESDHDVAVTFASGKTQSFSLVVAADGFRSRTRDLVFGEEVQFHYLRLYTAYLTIPRTSTDSRWARWCNVPGRKLFMLRPDNRGTTRASFTFWSDEDAYHGLSTDERRHLLKDKLRGTGWESERLIEGVDHDDQFYLDAVSQVKAPRWSKGRCALVGDAAYCPTPLTGMGTSLAIVGGYVLAGELARCEDHRDAFNAYEELMRPYVEKIQTLPPGVPRLVYPRTRWGVAVLNAFFALTASRPVKALMKLLARWKKRDSDAQEERSFPLPSYPI